MIQDAFLCQVTTKVFSDKRFLANGDASYALQVIHVRAVFLG